MLEDSVSRGRLWSDALRGFYRRTVPIEQLDAVSRWLYAGRLVILVISVQAAVIAGLLALPTGRMNGWFFIPLLIGFVVAHALSNLSNDFFGYKRGHDTPESPRVTYTIHPLAHGVLTHQSLRNGILVLWGIGVLIGAFFVVERGSLAALMFAIGVVILYLYDAAPTSLKSVGLGELASFIVWGPLMIGGGYFSLTGEFSWRVVAVGIPYGLGIAGILIGKHIDQAAFDRAHGVRTLPVILGERWSRTVNQVLVVLLYLLVAGLVALSWLTPFALLVLLNAPAALALVKACSARRPEVPPAGYVGWPLWFHRFNLRHNRRFGWLYILGIGLGAIWTLSGLKVPF